MGEQSQAWHPVTESCGSNVVEKGEHLVNAALLAGEWVMTGKAPNDVIGHYVSNRGDVLGGVGSEESGNLGKVVIVGMPKKKKKFDNQLHSFEELSKRLPDESWNEVVAKTYAEQIDRGKAIQAKRERLYLARAKKPIPLLSLSLPSRHRLRLQPSFFPRMKGSGLEISALLANLFKMCFGLRQRDAPTWG